MKFNLFGLTVNFSKPFGLSSDIFRLSVSVYKTATKPAKTACTCKNVFIILDAQAIAQQAEQDRELDAAFQHAHFFGDDYTRAEFEELEHRLDFWHMEHGAAYHEKQCSVWQEQNQNYNFYTGIINRIYSNNGGYKTQEQVEQEVKNRLVSELCASLENDYSDNSCMISVSPKQ